MQQYRLSGFQSGVLMQELGDQEYIQNKRKEWVEQGKICWINRVDPSNSQQYPDAV